MSTNHNTARILVIDDEEDLRDIIEYQFKSRGFQVMVAKDGIDGLEKLASFNPDLIILDLNMPRMGGIEFYQKICDANGHPSHHIIVLTARANTRQLFLDFEVDGFMTKPFEAEHLLKEAEIVLKKSNQSKDAKTATEFKSTKNLFVVDHRADELGKISASLFKAGYRVNTATGGSRAIERMMQEVPDLALINLSLVDIPGDLVVQRLMHMSKTMDIKFILYLDRNGNHDRAVLDGFSKKKGVIACVEYSSTDELLKTVDDYVAKEKKEQLEDELSH